jgi:hypothetical protein
MLSRRFSSSLGALSGLLAQLGRATRVEVRPEAIAPRISEEKKRGRRRCGLGVLEVIIDNYTEESPLV